ncbi:MAG: NADH-quinone oxidoreductase subunit A [Anaerolineae bacterium]
MPGEYLPILILIVVAGLFAALALAVPFYLGPRKPNLTKSETYESGKLPYGDARRRVSVHYYMVAMLFILFDIEVVFFYPWAVLFRKLKLFGLLEMGVFIGILLIGYIYIWKKGALEWDWTM